MTSKKSFLAAYDKCAESLLRHVYFRVSDEAVAEDILQETMLRVWRSVCAGEAIKNFRAYFYRVAHNLVIDHYRGRKEVSFEEILEGGEQFATKEKDALNLLADKDLAAAALKELDEETRTIVMWRFIDGLAVKEISEILGKTTGNISVIIHRGLKKLREKMKNV
jgi:RNA polymerase sigma-70 factor (ECF subfamily)